MSLRTPERCLEASGGHCMPKRRENRATGSTVSRIRSIAKTCSYTRGSAAVPMVVLPPWTDKVLSRSKRGARTVVRGIGGRNPQEEL